MLYTITMSYGSHTLYGFTSTLFFNFSQVLLLKLYNSINTTMHHVLYNSTSICQYIYYMFTHIIYSILYKSKLYIICVIIQHIVYLSYIMLFKQ